MYSSEGVQWGHWKQTIGPIAKEGYTGRIIKTGVTEIKGN